VFNLNMDRLMHRHGNDWVEMKPVNAPLSPDDEDPERLMLREVGERQCVAERLEKPVVSGRDHHPAVTCAEGLVWRQDGDTRSQRARRDARGEQADELVRDPVHRRFVQRHVDQLWSGAGISCPCPKWPR